MDFQCLQIETKNTSLSVLLQLVNVKYAIQSICAHSVMLKKNILLLGAMNVEKASLNSLKDVSIVSYSTVTQNFVNGVVKTISLVGSTSVGLILLRDGYVC